MGGLPEQLPMCRVVYALSDEYQQCACCSWCLEHGRAGQGHRRTLRHWAPLHATAVRRAARRLVQEMHAQPLHPVELARVRRVAEARVLSVCDYCEPVMLAALRQKRWPVLRLALARGAMLSPENLSLPEGVPPEAVAPQILAAADRLAGDMGWVSPPPPAPAFNDGNGGGGGVDTDDSVTLSDDSSTERVRSVRMSAARQTSRVSRDGGPDESVATADSGTTSPVCFGCSLPACRSVVPLLREGLQRHGPERLFRIVVSEQLPAGMRWEMRKWGAHLHEFYRYPQDAEALSVHLCVACYERLRAVIANDATDSTARPSRPSTSHASSENHQRQAARMSTSPSPTSTVSPSASAVRGVPILLLVSDGRRHKKFRVWSRRPIRKMITRFLQQLQRHTGQYAPCRFVARSAANPAAAAREMFLDDTPEQVGLRQGDVIHCEALSASPLPTARSTPDMVAGVGGGGGGLHRL
ncbi:hypothetical protein CDCA_CDCA18G4617 [Cyanidium caldarium]|uniref:Ubiquitin-like domain-containing protein n=1 Tax=Cyanidium caldarium TaxID=2771 RepID=A0AAV9J1W0_CYACA|nr:hypothetical protein CDCA_CDCA18G4617 [Cyanidium caldarium]